MENDNDPDKLTDLEKAHLSVLLEEYKSATAEIGRRATTQFQTLAFAVTIVAAHFTLVGTSVNPTNGWLTFWVLLSVAFFCSAFGFGLVSQDALIIASSRYIAYHLRPRVVKIAGQGLLEFESYRGQSDRAPRWFPPLIHALITILPHLLLVSLVLTAIVMYAYFEKPKEMLTHNSDLIWKADILLGTTYLIALCRTTYSYARLYGSHHTQS
ncbi:MAG: hypothetical protein ACO1SV_03510 [Fimbriimonas sp.]